MAHDEEASQEKVEFDEKYVSVIKKNPKENFDTPDKKKKKLSHEPNEIPIEELGVCIIWCV